MNNSSILLDFHHKYVVDVEEPIRYNMTGYPSGYDTWEVIVISIVVVFIMAAIIIGTENCHYHREVAKSYCCHNENQHN